MTNPINNYIHKCYPVQIASGMIQGVRPLRTEMLKQFRKLSGQHYESNYKIYTQVGVTLNLIQGLSPQFH
jgi:hypothetical protein